MIIFIPLPLLFEVAETSPCFLEEGEVAILFFNPLPAKQASATSSCATPSGRRKGSIFCFLTFARASFLLLFLLILIKMLRRTRGKG
jgi:hypothetical protein